MSKYAVCLKIEENGQIREQVTEFKKLKDAYMSVIDTQNVQSFKIYDVKQTFQNYLPKNFKRTFDSQRIRTDKDKRYSIEEVHALFDKWEELGSMSKRARKRISDTFDGYEVKTWSQRYELFRKNTKCVKCGLEANCYILEKDIQSHYWHFNLYHVAEDGTEILFTKDHIQPKSKNGKNDQSNYQTMCYNCNQIKADKYEVENV